MPYTNAKCRNDTAYAQQEKRTNALIYESVLHKTRRQNRKIKGNAITKNPANIACEPILTIPTVVHIIHADTTAYGEYENVTDEFVYDRIDSINKTLRHMPGAIYENPFNGADTYIELCLAQQTPDGMPTTGIERHIGNPIAPHGSLLDYTIPQTYGWDISVYFNIFLIREFEPWGGGYAFSNPALQVEGVVMVSFMGYVGWVHEAGHYLGLGHNIYVMPDYGIEHEDCSPNYNCLTYGDRVCDTPPQISTICPPIENTCSSDTNDVDIRNPYRPTNLGGLGDVNDNAQTPMSFNGANTCPMTFTFGQKKRMRANVLEKKYSLLTSLACTPPNHINDAGISRIKVPNIDNYICEPNFTPIVTLQNFGNNTINSATVYYELDGTSYSGFNWAGTLQTGQFIDIELPQVMVNIDDEVHAFYATIGNINGVPDAYTENDDFCVNFEAINLPVSCLIVTNTNDDGFGSLRDAIHCANGIDCRTVIEFDIAGTPPHTIQPQSELPKLRNKLVIDAATNGNQLGDIVLDGGLLSNNEKGLYIILATATKFTACKSKTSRMWAYMAISVKRSSLDRQPKATLLPITGGMALPFNKHRAAPLREMRRKTMLAMVCKFGEIQTFQLSTITFLMA